MTTVFDPLRVFVFRCLFDLRNLSPRRVGHCLAAGVALNLRYFSGGLGLTRGKHENGVFRVPSLRTSIKILSEILGVGTISFLVLQKGKKEIPASFPTSSGRRALIRTPNGKKRQIVGLLRTLPEAQQIPNTF